MSAPGLRRDAGPVGLLFASLGGMIGSGWLFGALNAAKIAGPAAMVSWVIGGGAVLLLAFVFAELSTMFPRPGAVIVFPDLCFGRLAAQVMSWINFLAYVAVAPIEAVAVVSYGNNFLPGMVVPVTGVLTLRGLGGAAGLMVVFLVINLLAIRLVLRINNAITWWKLAVPALTVVTLICVHFRVSNFTQFGFAPAGADGVFAAVSGSGIIFTYLGFRQAIELAGESANPAKALPFAILGSVLLCVLLYCGLQLAFIGALSPADLAQGWGHLKFPGISGPFAGLAGGLGLTWLAVTLYADAAISPGGTGIIYNTTASRVIYATADSGAATWAVCSDFRQWRARDQPGVELCRRVAVFAAVAVLAGAGDVSVVHRCAGLWHRAGGAVRVSQDAARGAVSAPVPAGVGRCDRTAGVYCRQSRGVLGGGGGGGSPVRRIAGRVCGVLRISSCDPWQLGASGMARGVVDWTVFWRVVADYVSRTAAWNRCAEQCVRGRRTGTVQRGNFVFGPRLRRTGSGTGEGAVFAVTRRAPYMPMARR